MKVLTACGYYVLSVLSVLIGNKRCMKDDLAPFVSFYSAFRTVIIRYDRLKMKGETLRFYYRSSPFYLLIGILYEFKKKKVSHTHPYLISLHRQNMNVKVYSYNMVHERQVYNTSWNIKSHFRACNSTRYSIIV